MLGSDADAQSYYKDECYWNHKNVSYIENSLYISFTFLLLLFCLFFNISYIDFVYYINIYKKLCTICTCTSSPNIPPVHVSHICGPLNFSNRGEGAVREIFQIARGSINWIRQIKIKCLIHSLTCYINYFQRGQFVHPPPPSHPLDLDLRMLHPYFNKCYY